VIFDPANVAPPDLLGEAVDDFDSGEIALMHGAVESLTGESLLMHRTVGIAVEKTAELVFKLSNAHLRLGDEGPGEILIIQPLAAFNRVHEMPLDGVAGRQRNIVAALHHARAAAFS